MIINLNGFMIDVDVDRTRKFYDELSELTFYCSCNDCRNYVLAVNDFPKAVLCFFGKLEIDLKKATEVFAWPCGEHVLCYGGFYHLCGKLVEENTSKIIYENRLIARESPVYSITPDYLVQFTNEVSLPEANLPFPAIQMEIIFNNIPSKV